jgi:DNA topoisomerase-3
LKEPAGSYAKKGAATRTAAAKTPATKAAAKKTAVKKAPPKTAAGLTPSPALAAVIGSEPVARTEATKKLWDYIKAHNLQDAKDRRSINADEKLRPVFGKPQVTMFEIAKVLGNHLS